MFKKNRGRVVLAVLLICAVIAPAAADDLLSLDENDLFGGSSEEELFGSSDDGGGLFGGGDALVEDVVETDLALNELMLTNEETVVIGGSYSFSVTPGQLWLLDADTDQGTLDVSLSSKLFFDARPDSDIRIYGEAVISYPFETVDETRTFDDIISIEELFSDFTIGDSIFFRVGKQTINWGVGYFFSPADLLNLSEIDPSDPEADLEGPLSIKMNVPVGIDNLYGYVIFPDGADDITDLAVAGKYETVLGAAEIGLGAYYREGQAPAAMMTISSGIGDISVFGEGVVRYGSDSDPDDDTLFFSATGGAMFSWSDAESDLGFSFAGQYYFNGEGLENNTMHYGAANLSVSLTSKLSTGLFWYGNMSDLSGILKPSLTWQPADHVSTSLGLNYLYGDMGDELSPFGKALAASVTFTLGGTSF